MSLIAKISRLTKIPQLLQRKEKHDKDSKKERRNKKESKNRPPFLFKDKSAFKKTETPVKIKGLLPPPKDTRKELGQHIDIRV